jgi:hypothetical protein
MRLAACTLLALVACNTGNEGDDYYVEPGNGGGTFGTTIGSGGTDGGTTDGGNDLHGALCMLPQLRDWVLCDSGVDLDGFHVYLGAADSGVASDGTFQIAAPTGTPTWTSIPSPGFNARSTIQPFGSEPHIVFTVSNPTREDLAAPNAITLDDTRGELFVRVRGGTTHDPIASATVTTTPAATNVLYATNDPDLWDGLATNGNVGTVWIPNLTTGPVSVKVTLMDGTTNQVVSTRTEAGKTTFVTVDF